MQFKVGDKVSFLNEAGGGTVSRIISPQMVEVAIEEGFDIPVKTSDLVLDRRRSAGFSEETTPISSAEPIKKQDIEAEPEPFSRSSRLRMHSKPGYPQGVYLAFEPHDQQWFITGKVDVYLVNHTPFQLIYSLFLKQENIWRGIDFDRVEPRSKLLLETLEREYLDDWSDGILQALLHHDEPEVIYQPVQASFTIHTQRFFKENSYQSSGLVDGRALIYTLSELAGIMPASASNNKTDQSLAMQKAEIKKDTPLISKHRTQKGEATVDLHIGEILDNIAGMSSHELFQAQFNYFKDCLNSAIQEQYNKVIFIHGVGNGVLKNAIINFLNDVDNLESKQASLLKFGVGALEVTIHNN